MYYVVFAFQLAEKESELTRLRSHKCDSVTDRSGDLERSRAAQLQAERLLEAREQSHRQQVLRLENQVTCSLLLKPAATTLRMNKSKKNFISAPSFFSSFFF